MSTMLTRQKNHRRRQTKKRDHHRLSIVRISDYASVSFAVKTISRLTAADVPTEAVKAKEAYGRVVSKDIVSPINVPGKQRSHMDGYAVIARDLEGASPRSPKALSLIGDVSLTGSRKGRLSSSETIGVSTGGEIPGFADSVGPVEDAKRIGDRVYFSRETEKGQFCFPVGVDVQRGSVVIRAGSKVRAQDIGMLALLRIGTVRAFARPRVAIIATGNELVDAFTSNHKDMVRESHSPILESLIREAGGVVSVRTIVTDDVALVAAATKRALRVSDIVLTLGGTSLGEGDLVEQALRRVSKDVRIIHGIRMDRGRVAGLAAVHGKPVVMLPGPVQGAMNAFLILALPLISRLTVGEKPPEYVSARLSKNWSARRRFEDFTKVLYVHLERRTKKKPVARPIVGETESMSVLTQSNGFVTVPERIKTLRAGDEVSVRILPGFSYVGHSSFD